MRQHPGASLRFHFVARQTESPNDVTTNYATASRCTTTAPLRGETDRITTRRYKILRPVSHPPNVHSFVGTARTSGAVPPAEKKIKVLHLSRCSTHAHTHTLDKNGSLYDPAGTESCNVQIQKIRIAMLIPEIKYQIATTVK